MIDSYGLMRQIEERIAALPAGYISKKNINGKTRYYLQWKENGKVKSQYLREKEAEEIRAQIEERRRLKERLKELKKKFPTVKENVQKFETKVRAGNELAEMAIGVKGFEKREVYHRIPQYLYGNVRTRVCVIYGLRRTGKTTMLLQAIADMSEEDFRKAAYIKLRTVDEMDSLTRDLDRLYQG